MLPTNPPLRHYGNFKLKELEKKIHQVPDSFVLLPKSRRRSQHTKDRILVLEEDGILMVRIGVEMEKILSNYILLKITYEISGMRKKFHKAPSLDEEL